LPIIVDTIPVGGPLPDVTGHVVKAVPVGRERSHGRGRVESIVVRVFVWKVPLKSIRHVLPIRTERVAPNERFSSEAATGGELPLRFGGKTLAGPLCVSESVVIGDVDDRVIFLAFDAAVGAIRMSPICPLHIAPPLEIVV
jgi:hypothetical protein